MEMQITEELKKQAEYYSNAHMQVFETWQEGKMQDCWRDEEGNLCIRYESGRYWHYRGCGNGVQWW